MEAGRGLSAKQVAKVAKGRVWTGEQVRPRGSGLVAGDTGSSAAALRAGRRCPQDVPAPCCHSLDLPPMGLRLHNLKLKKQPQALELGLVDELGGLQEALARAKREAGLPQEEGAVRVKQARAGLAPLCTGAAASAQARHGVPAPRGAAPTLSPPPASPSPSPAPARWRQVYPERKSPLAQAMKLARGDSSEGGAAPSQPEAAPAAWAAAALGPQLTAGEWALLQQLQAGSLAPQCVDPAAERLAASL